MDRFFTGSSEHSGAQSNFSVAAGTIIKTTQGVTVNLQDMDLRMDGTLNQAAGEGTFKFSGSQNNNLSGNNAAAFDILEIAKTGSAKILLQQNSGIVSSVNFTSGLIDLGNFHLLLQPERHVAFSIFEFGIKQF
ncbi:MAG: hypothetical protein WDN26_24565 [Chitinophagaceae bacterium]